MIRLRKFWQSTFTKVRRWYACANNVDKIIGFSVKFRVEWYWYRVHIFLASISLLFRLRLRNFHFYAQSREDQYKPTYTHIYHATWNLTLNPNIKFKFLFRPRNLVKIERYRWLRQSKHSRDSNGKILPCWLVSNTFRISSGTKTSASSFLKTFGESIFNDECENCLTSCDLLVVCEVTKFGFDIPKMKISKFLISSLGHFNVRNHRLYTWLELQTRFVNSMK